MNTRDKNEGGTLTLVEAVETLSSIADLEFDRSIGIAQKHQLILQNQQLTYHTIHWLHRKDATLTVNIVKDIFRTVLNYLRNFYTTEYGTINNQEAIEGIKTIMVLVGEAAKKLDKYTTLFHDTRIKSVIEMKEYQELQNFYLNRIARKIDEGTIGKWILGLSNKIHRPAELKIAGRKSHQTQHVFIDLESVKKDTEYELFYIRKEDGTRFFSPRLIRNIKLVSDFGDYFGDIKTEGSLTDVFLWNDQCAYVCSKKIVNTLKAHIDRFYRETKEHKNYEFVQELNKAIMALMLCSNSHNQFHDVSFKSCLHYFKDFQIYLRTCLQSGEYHRLVTYPPSKSNKLAHCLLNLVHGLCLALYTQLASLQNLRASILGILRKAETTIPRENQKLIKKPHDLCSSLSHDYGVMTSFLKLHPNGGINKVLSSLEEDGCREFDPFMQNNIPTMLYNLYLQDQRIGIARWPTPTVQQFIHKASISDEFKGFLRGCSHGHTFNKCLVINFQDRTSWKEYIRCFAIEDLPNHESFTKHIDIVTIAKDTAFYHQLAPYSDNNHAETFIKQFREHLSDESSGFLFPNYMKKVLFSEGFVDGVMNGIYSTFFSGRNIFLREHRLDFIEIFYLFLQMKIIELAKVNIVGFVCKDGIDITQTATTQLFVFLKFLNQERLSENDREEVDLLLYEPSLLHRERVIQPDRFYRMLSVIKCLESARDQAGNHHFVKTVKSIFDPYFTLPILHSKISVQQSKDAL